MGSFAEILHEKWSSSRLPPKEKSKAQKWKRPAMHSVLGSIKRLGEQWVDEWKQMCGTMGMSSQRPLKHESRLRIRPLKQHKETYLSWRIRNLKFLDFECRPYGIKPPIRQLTCLLCGCFRMFPSFVYWRFVNFSDPVATSLARKMTALTILLFWLHLRFPEPGAASHRQAGAGRVVLIQKHTFGKGCFKIHRGALGMHIIAHLLHISLSGFVFVASFPPT